MPTLTHSLARMSMAVVVLWPVVAQADDIILVSPDFWCPFSCKAGAAHEGFTVDIIREIFTHAGHRVLLVNENYSRALVSVRSGKYTAIPSTLPSEAPDFVFPSVPVSRNRYCFYVEPASSWNYTGPASLNGRKTGIVQSYSYGAQMDDLIKARPTDFVSTSGDNLTERMAQRVTLHRLDGLVEEESLLSYTFKLNPARALRNAGCLPATWGYMAISPSHPKAQEYARLFSEGMLRLGQSGRLKEILGRYGIASWPVVAAPAVAR